MEHLGKAICEKLPKAEDIGDFFLLLYLVSAFELDLLMCGSH